MSFSAALCLFPHLVLAGQIDLDKVIRKKIETMSLEEKVGQLFMLGFQQKNLTPDLEQHIRKYRPGSFLLFKRNITSLSQILELNRALYKASFKYTRLPPLIAIDQEGGSVSRLPIVPAPPNALAVGQTRSPLLAEGLGFETGRFLRSVGFNMNLAPVLDVTNPTQNSFIGVRSFGADPALVAELGTAYAKGLLQAHVIPTAKHFPGTGSMTGDPHHQVLRNMSSFEDLQNKDLKPFEEYSKLGSRTALMLSHLIYPHLDSSNEPASFSHKISTELLRHSLKYKGLVITDDLQMQGAKQLLRPEVSALRALQSGADIIMLTWSIEDQKKAFQHVLQAAQTGTLTKVDLESKVQRILTAKAYVNSVKNTDTGSIGNQERFLTSEKYTDFVDEILEKIVKSELKLNSLNTTKRSPASLDKKICVVAPSSSFIRSFLTIKKRSVVSKLIDETARSEAISEWIKKTRCSLIVSAITGKKTAGLFSKLSKPEKSKILAVNLGAPSLLPNDKEYLRVVKLYFNHVDSGKKIAQHLDQILRELNYQIVSN